MNSARRNHRRTLTISEQAERLKEGIYLIFAALAVTLALRVHGHIAAGEALLTLTVTMLGTVLAVFTADMIAHFLSHEKVPNRAEFAHALRVSFGALPAVVLPFILLGISALTHWPVKAALQVSAIGLVVVLVLLGYRAVRKLSVSRWKKLMVLAIEAALALGVIGLQVLAHQ